MRQCTPHGTILVLPRGCPLYCRLHLSKVASFSFIYADVAVLSNSRDVSGVSVRLSSKACRQAGRSSLCPPYGAAFQIDREIPPSTRIFGPGSLMHTLVALCLFGRSGDRQPNKSRKNIAASAPSPGVSVSGPATRQRQKSTAEKRDSPVCIPPQRSIRRDFLSFSLFSSLPIFGCCQLNTRFYQGIDLSFRSLLVSLKLNKPYCFPSLKEHLTTQQPGWK
jgi:hypothetical protein